MFWLNTKGRTLIDWQRAALQEAGVTDIAIVTGYRADMLSDQGLKTFHNANWAATNMVASLATASDWLEAEPCIVSYSDIFYDAEAVCALKTVTDALAITYDANWRELWTRRFDDPLLDAETFRITNAGVILEIGQKPQSIDEVQGQFMGLLRFMPEGWAELCRCLDTLSEERRGQDRYDGDLADDCSSGSD